MRGAATVVVFLATAAVVKIEVEGEVVGFDGAGAGLDLTGGMAARLFGSVGASPEILVVTDREFRFLLIFLLCKTLVTIWL
ncbi:hypothetical protein Ct61P_13877 [Colletotrichum tofieldiae]|nr:hypothetical protein Ct61P_13877 [Colletotrichum tofieldiae]